MGRRHRRLGENSAGPPSQVGPLQHRGTWGRKVTQRRSFLLLPLHSLRRHCWPPALPRDRPRRDKYSFRPATRMGQCRRVRPPMPRETPLWSQGSSVLLLAAEAKGTPRESPLLHAAAAIGTVVDAKAVVVVVADAEGVPTRTPPPPPRPPLTQKRSRRGDWRPVAAAAASALGRAHASAADQRLAVAEYRNGSGIAIGPVANGSRSGFA